MQQREQQQQQQQHGGGPGLQLSSSGKSEIALAVRTSMTDSVTSIIAHPTFKDTLSGLVKTETFKKAVVNAAESAAEPPSKKVLTAAVREQIEENGGEVAEILTSCLKPQLNEATKVISFFFHFLFLLFAR